MIKALFLYLTTSCFAPWVRKMGFLYETIAMDGRYGRCRTQWQAHFDHCQQAIRQAVSRCEQSRHIVILGAGSLKDIPLSHLSQTFDKVYLVDLVFLQSARKQAALFVNVHLVEADVTGCLSQVFQGNMRCHDQMDWLDDEERIDCVVSLNLTTQLPLVPVSWLMKKYSVPTERAGAFGKKMVEQHLSLLNSLPGQKCLISDRWIKEYDTSGKEVDSFDPAWDVTLPDAGETWDWEVIPLSESTTQTRQVNQVGVSYWC